MKPRWMIQVDMEGVDTKRIVDAVKSQDMEVIEVVKRLGHRTDLSGYSEEDCIVFYGDIDFVKHVRRDAAFIPGAWCDFHNMRCSVYYAYFGQYLLNRAYTMMPLGDLPRHWDNLTAYAPDRSLFIRPDSGAKPFTGHVIPDSRSHEIQALIKTVGPETLVVVSPKRDITAEWRFVVCDRKVIAGSQYLPEEIELTDHFLRCCSPTSFRLAQDIASNEWQPDVCYTIDIAESGWGCEVSLLEINSFSCAGFYSCDINAIVKHASAAATKEWEEYRDPNSR